MSPEVAKEKQPYENRAELILGLVETASPEAIEKMVEDFLQSLEVAVAAGRVETSATKSGERGPMEADVLHRNEAEVYDRLSNPEETDLEEVLRLFPSDQGIRAGVKLLLSNEKTKEIVKNRLRLRMLALEKELGIEQARPAADRIMVGKEAVEDVVTPVAEAKTPQAMLEELTAGLSDSDKLHLERYTEAMMSKRDAQKAGEGQNSTYWGQIAGQHYRDLSPAAKAAAPQYETLYPRA